MGLGDPKCRMCFCSPSSPAQKTSFEVGISPAQGAQPPSGNRTPAPRWHGDPATNSPAWAPAQGAFPRKPFWKDVLGMSLPDIASPPPTGSDLFFLNPRYRVFRTRKTRRKTWTRGSPACSRRDEGKRSSGTWGKLFITPRSSLSFSTAR